MEVDHAESSRIVSILLFMVAGRSSVLGLTRRTECLDDLSNKPSTDISPCNLVDTSEDDARCDSFATTPTEGADTANQLHRPQLSGGLTRILTVHPPMFLGRNRVKAHRNSSLKVCGTCPVVVGRRRHNLPRLSSTKVRQS